MPLFLAGGVASGDEEAAAHFIDTNPRDTAVQPIIAFIGNCVTFTDRLMQTVEAEFEGISVVRLKDPQELVFLSPQQRSLVKLILIDESMADKALDHWQQFSSQFPDASLGLAYVSIQSARHYLTGAIGDALKLRCIPMRAPIDAWLAALRLLLLGQAFVPSELLSIKQEPNSVPLVDAEAAMPPKPSEPPEQTINGATGMLAKLTKRERQIIDFVARGNRNKSIAKALGLSEHTVKLHVHHIFGKIGVSNRTSATHWYMTHREALMQEECD